MKAQYTEGGMILLTRDDGGQTFVPDDMTNRDRLEVAEWESQGNTIEPFQDTDQQIRDIPTTLFGGPSIGELFNGN